jgi:hypothetical protein
MRRARDGTRTRGTARIVSDMADAPGHPQHGMTVSQRLAAALGRPAPRPLSETEAADLERRQDEADAAAERLYGIRGQAA